MTELKFCCEQMQFAVTNDDVPIVYEPKFREYGILVLDEGTSTIELLYCPWSGHKLPMSLRDRWFDELERMNIDPIGGDIPEEFLDDRWYAAGANGE